MSRSDLKLYVLLPAVSTFLVALALDVRWSRALAIVALALLMIVLGLRLAMALRGRRRDGEDDDGGTPKHYDGALLLEKPTKTPPEWRA